MSIHKDVRRLIFREYLNHVDRYFLMKSLHFDQPLTEKIVIDCISEFELFDWLILNVNIPFIKNLDVHIAGKGYVKHLKYIRIRDSLKCAVSATKYENKEILAYLKSVYPQKFISTGWCDDFLHTLALLSRQ